MAMRHDIAARLIQMSGRFLLNVPDELRFAGQDLPAPVTVQIPTSAGSVQCAIYRPAATGETPPVFVNLHGGGYVWRRPEQDDHICRHLASEAGCVVLNIDYWTAPQHRFPTAPVQAYEVCEWAAKHGAEHGWDGERLAVGGHSAGGGLTAGVCRTARDRRTFTPLLQILDYPVLDQVSDPATKRARTRRPMISPPLSRIFTGAYVPDLARRRDPLASPGLATDLAGLPPALVITAEYDSLRDEGDAYAKALASAGVPVVHRMVKGVDHAFTHKGPTETVRTILDLMAEQLRAAFSVQT
ncbi:alpha/beta hydrolase [Streptomyces sp. NPDC057579]|uniref:alpha/beta hydrolase n=1 Tax=Streptomyces sp. NPDC057579 TaxID=3346172 RepID=UPI00368E910D